MFVQECRDQAQVDVWRPILCGMLEVGVQIGGYSCVEVRGNFPNGTCSCNGGMCTTGYCI